MVAAARANGGDAIDLDPADGPIMGMFFLPPAQLSPAPSPPLFLPINTKPPPCFVLQVLQRRLTKPPSPPLRQRLHPPHRRCLRLQHPQQHLQLY